MYNYVCLPSAKYQPDFVCTANKCLGTPLDVALQVMAWLAHIPTPAQ